ncbi:unnamed protein product [Soboliphyme baturini]|uniref:Arm_2 domain-containing protein n=1 Tax=Soboliphyme baturini TaxID=241478 RepID=A0A183ICL6_9BILA|nr:unnamed protein product [Soboliphyme baturini]
MFRLSPGVRAVHNRGHCTCPTSAFGSQVAIVERRLPQRSRENATRPSMAVAATVVNKSAMIAIAFGTGVFAFYVFRKTWLAGLKRVWFAVSKGMGNDASKAGGGTKTAGKKMSLKNGVSRPSCDGSAANAEEKQSLLLTPSTRTVGDDGSNVAISNIGSKCECDLEETDDSDEDSGDNSEIEASDTAVVDLQFQKRESSLADMLITLDSLFRYSKIINDEEARLLNTLLRLKAPDTLLKVLTTLSNLATFTLNQNLLRQLGVLKSLTELLDDCTLTDAEKLMLVQCIGNIAVNQSNNKYLQAVPCLVALLDKEKQSPDVIVRSLNYLTNLYKMAENPEVIHHVLDRQLLPLLNSSPTNLLPKTTVDQLNDQLVALHNYPDSEISDRVDYLMELVEEYYCDN